MKNYSNIVKDLAKKFGWIKDDSEKETCLFEEHMKKEREKPIELRNNYAYIYCPCSKCNKYNLK